MSDQEFSELLDGKRVTVISSLRKALGISGILEEELIVTRFRRALRPEGKRKKLLIQFYALKPGERLYKFGGRLYTFRASDIADIDYP